MVPYYFFILLLSRISSLPRGRYRRGYDLDQVGRQVPEPMSVALLENALTGDESDVGAPHCATSGRIKSSRGGPETRGGGAPASCLVWRCRRPP